MKATHIDNVLWKLQQMQVVCTAAILKVNSNLSLQNTKLRQFRLARVKRANVL